MKKVRFNANDSKPVSYQFNYNDTALPNRMSYARDWWGYYNGKDLNRGLTLSGTGATVIEENDRNVYPDAAKAGSLREIIYPTGGKTKFEFESNRGIFYESHSIGDAKFHDAVPTVARYYFTSTHEDDAQLVNKVYNIPFAFNINDLTTDLVQSFSVNTTTNKCIYPELALPTIHSCSIYYSVLDNDNNVVMGRGLLQDNYSRTLSIPRDKLLNGLKVKMEVYSGKVGHLYQYFNYLEDEATITLSHKVIDTTRVKVTPAGLEVPLGGLRIQKIENYENIQNPVIKEYNYAYNGIETGTSLFELDFIQTTPGKLFVTSQSRFPMQTGNGSLVLYTNAAEYRVNPITNERNTISHIFENKYYLGSFIGSCLFNDGLGDGLQSSSVPCFEDPRNGKPLFINYADKQKEYYEYPDMISPFSGKNLNRVYGMDYDRVIKPIDYNYTNIIGTASPTYLGASFFYYNFKNFDEPDYSKEVKENLNGQELVTKTQYSSLSPNHHQITKQTTILPDATVNETNYIYAHEKSNQLMITKNMIGIPLETTSTQTIGTTTKTLGKTETIYPTALPTSQAGNLVLPLSVKSYDTLNPNTVVTDVKYDKYDEKGNLLQYTTKEGTPVTILWGYNKTQPIAQIEDMTYDQLTGQISAAAVSASDEDAADPSKEVLLLDALNTFRKNSVFAGKKVTTYTYDPLIGVTSITAPTGIREVYLYDSANRLKEVKVREKDSTGNYVLRTVKQFNYNYKP